MLLAILYAKHFENERGMLYYEPTNFSLFELYVSADWRSCRKMETGARMDKWRGEYPLHTAGPPRSQPSRVRINPGYYRLSLTHARTPFGPMATQPREHSMPSQMVNFMFTVSFAKRGGSASNEKLNLAEILQSDTARYIHRALKTIFHSDFSCSNINSCSWERRARIMNDCSSCLTPTGLPQLSCVPLHSQLKDFVFFF